MSDDQINFHVGDTNLVFLGYAAALYARHQAHRKAGLRYDFKKQGMVLPAGFADSCDAAIDCIRLGVQLGENVPLEDIPEFGMVVSGGSDAIKGLLARVRRYDSIVPPELQEEIDKLLSEERDEGEGWKGGLTP